jgi:nitroimidazol reductase NimA-like FMN-containing flavoprotein (pyridoxamine 5'-phosphate oxidase superfamily)
MQKPEEFKARLRELMDSQSLGVVATQSEGQPYASLVAFVTSGDLKRIYFVTPKATRKFSYLSKDRRVAILINNSTNQAEDFHRAISVTAVGAAVEISGAEREQVLKPYLAKHPHLEDFVKSPSCAMVRITLRSYYMVRNFQNVTELHFEP